MDAIYFDMDGTIADLYSVNNWCYKITHDDASPYKQAKPLVNIAQLQKILQAFKALGITVGVISWGAKGASAQFTREVKKRKKEWCTSLGLEFDEFHVVKYGTKKQSVAKIKNAVLVDDSLEVLESWNGTTIDAYNSRTLINQLGFLLEDLAA
jgi:hypothetical protein